MSRFQPTDNWIESEAGVTDEVATFIYASNSSLADQADKIFHNLRGVYSESEMENFKAIIAKIKIAIREIKVNGGEL